MALIKCKLYHRTKCSVILSIMVSASRPPVDPDDVSTLRRRVFYGSLSNFIYGNEAWNSNSPRFKLAMLLINLTKREARCSGKFAMIRPTSQLIFCLFLEQFEDFLQTYNTNGEIEVWRNTLPRLVDTSLLGPEDTEIIEQLSSYQ